MMYAYFIIYVFFVIFGGFTFHCHNFKERLTPTSSCHIMTKKFMVFSPCPYAGDIGYFFFF